MESRLQHPTLAEHGPHAADAALLDASGPVRARTATRGWALPLAVVLTLALLLGFPSLVYPLAPDHGTYALVGKGLVNGQLPYVDVWEVKPPAVYYVYALPQLVFGDSVPGLRLIDLLFTLGTTAGIFLLGARLQSVAVGFWSALIFVALYYRQPFWVPLENDALALLPMVFAALFALKAGDAAAGSRRAIGFAFLAGILSGIAFWFKYPFVLFVAALVVAHLIRRTRVSLGATVREAVGFAVGALLVVGGVVAYYAALGVLDDMIETARVTVGYTTLAYSLSEYLRTMREPIMSQLSWLNLGWILLLIARWPFPGSGEPRDGRRWALIWLWLLSAAAIMLIQAKGYAYHWDPMLPPLALLAADSLERLLVRVAASLQRHRLRLGYGLLAAVVAIGFAAFTASTSWDDTWRYITGRETQVDYFNRLNTGPALAADSLNAADYIRQRVPPDSTLFVWGYRPEVYFMSGLEPATRFVFHQPIIGEWYPDAWREEAVADLEANRPPYIVVARNDLLGQLTGYDEDSLALLARVPELNAFLRENYVDDTEIGDFLILRRADFEPVTA